jgi:hypothetical protein
MKRLYKLLDAMISSMNIEQEEKDELWRIFHELQGGEETE